MAEAWSQADAYDAFMGRWSRRLAPAFLDWCQAPRRVAALDVGCGTGSLSEALLAHGVSSLIGIDLSPGYVEAARRRFAASGVPARFEVADATRLPVPERSVGLAVSGLVLNFVPNPAAMVAELRRVVAPGGLAGVFVWDYAEGMEFLRRFWDAALELDPDAAPLDEGRRFPVCRPEALQRLFQEAGFREARTGTVEVETVFSDFQDYWRPFLGGQGPAPGYVAALDDARRARLRDALDRSLGRAPDGGIRLRARAYAVRGVK